MTTNAGDTKEDAALQQRMGGDESEKSRRLLKAVQFLQDQNVRSTPVANKVQFLMSKGLSIEELCEAFEKSGQLASSDGVKKLVNASSSFQAAQGAGGSLLSPEYAAVDHAYLPRQNVSSTYAPPVHLPHQQQQHFSQEMLDTKESGWGDYVIAAAGGLFGLFAAFKAFQTYSPYEIRRKDETLKLRRRNGFERRNRGRERHVSSDADSDLVNERQLKTMAPPLPEIPSQSDGRTLAPTCASGDAQEEVKKLQADLKDAQEALEKEKRSKAELSVTLGKLRGQFLTQSRANENLELKVKSLQQELDELRKTTDDNSQTGENALDSANQTEKPGYNEHINDDDAVSLSSEHDQAGIDVVGADLNQKTCLKETEVVPEA